jgi:hypothetical protein
MANGTFKRAVTTLCSLLLIVPLCAWPACNQDQQAKAMRAVVTMYSSAMSAGVLLRSLHDSGSLSDEGYRESLLKLKDTRLILREMTDQIEALPELDANNKQLVEVFINRVAESLNKLAAVGAFHLSSNPQAAQNFRNVVAVGTEAAKTIFTFINKINKPVKLPQLEIKSGDIGAWLQTAEVIQ